MRILLQIFVFVNSEIRNFHKNNDKSRGNAVESFCSPNKKCEIKVGKSGISSILHENCGRQRITPEKKQKAIGRKEKDVFNIDTANQCLQEASVMIFSGILLILTFMR